MSARNVMIAVLATFIGTAAVTATTVVVVMRGHESAVVSELQRQDRERKLEQQDASRSMTETGQLPR